MIFAFQSLVYLLISAWIHNNLDFLEVAVINTVSVFEAKVFGSRCRATNPTFPTFS